MNLVEKVKQLQAWAHWKEIEVNREKDNFNEEWLESQMDFISSIRELCQAVVDSAEVIGACKKQLEFAGETHPLDPGDFKREVKACDIWLSRYAEKEKKDE